MRLLKTELELKEQWEKVASTEMFRDFIAQGHSTEEAFRKIGEEQSKSILKYLGENGISLKGKRLVEVGAGAGRLTEFFAKEAELIYATDISMAMLDHLQERLGDVKNVVTLCTGNLDVIPNNTVDIIFSFLVFQHLPEDLVIRFFKHGHSALKPGGYFIFQLPIRDEHEVVKSKSRATDMVRWTKHEVLTLTNLGGYKPINEIGSNLNIWQKI